MDRFSVTAAAAARLPGKPSNYEHLVVNNCLSTMLVLGLTPTFHRILQIEEQRREWERTKEELGHVKKQVAEKVSTHH
jgi:hypothetical protein